MDIEEGQIARTAARYARFADEEARGRSPYYEELARGVSGDREILEFLLTLPEAKWQPNLLFAAVSHLFGSPGGWDGFRRALLADPDTVRSLMLARSTQTNEPARCAALLPVLARLPQPLALVEVGASAGLCLLPDLYGYDYGRASIRPSGAAAEAPVFACSASEATPLPTAMPRIAWRAGLDLNPLDVADPADTAWLETLVWPGQEGRLADLRAAVRIAAAYRPRVVRGDLLGSGLARLCREAPGDVTLVVFHTAVLAYVADPADRRAFAAEATRLCRYWVSNESPRVFPEIAASAGPGRPGRFLMSVNGSTVAWTDPHGASIDWIAGDGRRRFG